MGQTGEPEKIKKRRILVAPLDWGLGHATRCIPVIGEFIRQGCEVTLAGEGAQEELLKKEFPSLPFLQLPGYRIRYAATGVKMPLKIISQVPALLNAIKSEHLWMVKKAEEQGFDAIISDNRYGLYHEKIPSILITHQLLIKSPWSWTEKILQKKLYRYIQRFTACWVPDREGPGNLAGELSHPSRKPGIPLHYTGHLSRCRTSGIKEIKGHLLILISGPEPQRSIFENLIISQVAGYQGSATVLRGLPSSASVIPSTNTIHFYNHLPADALSAEMEKASFVIARSGYSTIMDAAALKKKCILVPTPGQTEQEYLAGYLHGRFFAVMAPQKKFSLPYSLEQAASFPYRFPEDDKQSNLENAVSRLLESC